MKTYLHYDHLPRTARYLGSEHGDGTIDESLADAIADAIEPVRLRDDDGIYSYFDLGA